MSEQLKDNYYDSLTNKEEQKVDNKPKRWKIKLKPEYIPTPNELTRMC